MNQKEIYSLKKELEDFKKEKERVRTIVGAIGGKKDKKREFLINIIFVIVVLIVFILATLKYVLNIDMPLSSPFITEIGLLLVSIKIILLMNQQMKIGHFQFWILNSIEFRLSDLSKKIIALEKKHAK